MTTTSPHRVLPIWLALVLAIAAGALACLKPGGWLLVEHGHDQAEAVADIWKAAGLVNVTGRADLSGNPRMTGGQKPEGLSA